MGSRERIERKKQETACAIIEAAMEILVQDGEQGMSMRRIAEKIEYTSPIIYAYYKDKDAILKALATVGYIKINQIISKSLADCDQEPEKITRILFCVVEFAIKNDKLYKLMSSLALNEPTSLDMMPEVKTFVQTFRTEIERHSPSENSESLVTEKFYTIMALTHGIISVCYISPDYTELQKNNMVHKLMRCIMESGLD